MFPELARKAVEFAGKAFEFGKIGFNFLKDNANYFFAGTAAGCTIIGAVQIISAKTPEAVEEGWDLITTGLVDFGWLGIFNAMPIFAFLGAHPALAAFLIGFACFLIYWVNFTESGRTFRTRLCNVISDRYAMIRKQIIKKGLFKVALEFFSILVTSSFWARIALLVLRPKDAFF